MSLKSIKTWIGYKGEALPAASAYKRGQINIEHPSSGRDKAYLVIRDGSDVHQQSELAFVDDLLTLVVQEGDVDVDTDVSTLDFDASDFNVSSSPAGEVNISLAYGTSAGTPAEGDHTHVGGGSTVIVQSGDVDVDTAAATLDFDASDFTLASAPAGEVNISLNYAPLAGRPAEGNHTHAASLIVQEGDSTVDSAVGTLDFDASDFNVTSSPAGEANIALAYGTGAGTPAEGNHAHSLDSLTDVTIAAVNVGVVLASDDGSTFEALTLINHMLGPFFAFNTAISTTVQMSIQEPTASGTMVHTIGDFYMAKAGRVVGMFLNSNANRTAGTVTGTVYLNGASTTFNSGGCVLDATNVRRHSSFVAVPGAGVAFSAGDRVGMGIVTSGAWAPTTADFSGRIVVQYTPY